jgi:thiosulfate/3-mercaptopyruvate sulfurtransferase
MLVSTEWLEQHLGDPGLRIVDADQPLSYLRAHIPGAVGHLNANVYLKTADGETFLMGPDQFSETMSRMGIGDGTPVVAYDGQRGLLAARLWWAMRYYGHDDVRILNGGWNRWLSEGRPAVMTPTKPAPATFTPRRREDALATCDLLRSAGDGTVLLDVRTDGEWSGANDRGNKRRGHVPGAIHVEWTNFTDDHHVFKPAAELREMLRAKGVTPDKNVYTY